jgi:hypothetical protein
MAMSDVTDRSRDRGGRFAAEAHDEAGGVDLAEPRSLIAARYLAAHQGTAEPGAAAVLEGTVWFPEHHVTVGVVDDAAHDAFRTGQCHALALALHERTGWPLVVIGPKECCYDEDCMDEETDSTGACGCQVTHIAVQRPDGQVVDIDGTVPVDDAILASDDPDMNELRPLSEDRLEEILGSSKWRVPDLAVARGYVDAVLAIED